MIKPITGASVTGDAVLNGLAIPPAGAALVPHYGAALPPQPDLTRGTLWHAETIELTAQQFNVRLDFLYNNAITSEFGEGWSANVRQFVDATHAAQVVTVTRGDMTQYGFTPVGTSGGITTFTASDGATSTLAYNGTQYSESFPDGQMLIYESIAGGTDYRLVNSIDPTGSVQTLTHTGAIPDTLTSIEVPGGQRITLTYQTNSITKKGVLETVTDWNGRIWSFTSGGAGTPITSIEEPNGCITEFTYSGSNLIAHQDPQGYTTSFTGGTAGQPAAVQGGSSAWSYSWLANTNVVQLPSGALVTYNFNPTTGLASTIQHPEGYTETLTWDANGRHVMSVTPAGATYSVIFDTRTGQVAQQWDGTGNSASAKYDANGNCTTLVSPNGAVISMTYAPGSTSRSPIYVVDADGVSLSYTYYASGLLKSVQDGRGLFTSYTWDSRGNLIATRNPDGGISTNTFDILNRLIVSTDPLSRSTSYSYDLADNLITTQDPTGAVSSNIYASCLLIATLNALGFRSSYSYDRFQNRVTSQDAMGAVTSNIVDNNGYVIASEDPLGNRTSQIFNAARQLLATQDPLGNRTSNLFDNAGRQIATQNARGYITTQVLDTQSRVLATVDALGNRSSSVFAAAGFSVNDAGMGLGGDSAANFADVSYQVQPLGFSTSNVYSPAGRTIATVDALSYRTSMSYDLAGNKTVVQDANGFLTSMVYQANSERIAATIDPTGAITSNFWDAAGQQIAVQNANGFVLSTTFDKAGRVWATQNAIGAFATNTYDLVGQKIASLDALNRLSSTIFDGNGRTIANVTPLGNRSSMVGTLRAVPSLP